MKPFPLYLFLFLFLNYYFPIVFDYQAMNRLLYKHTNTIQPHNLHAKLGFKIV